MQEIQETQAASLGQEDPLTEEMATHCSILTWEMSWTEEPGGLQSMGQQRVRQDGVTEHIKKHGKAKLPPSVFLNGQRNSHSGERTDQCPLSFKSVLLGTKMRGWGSLCASLIFGTKSFKTFEHPEGAFACTQHLFLTFL